jgi:hypothetical protein
MGGLGGHSLDEGSERFVWTLADLVNADRGHLRRLGSVAEPVTDAPAERDAASMCKVGERLVDVRLNGDREADSVIHGAVRKW